MLEKIGLPAKPSLRGSNWVVDASHCQGCSSQFTFINRKHHCRRCGGIFCNSCTQQRMILRGQGDSPVRICEPCKKLEEAARFELRYGHKGRAGKGGSKMSLKDDDEILNQILGTNVKDSYSSGQCSSRSMNSSSESATNSASCSSTQDAAADSMLQDDTTSASPEELRQQAVEEKKQYKILKGKGKPEEALRAFKRGKELERQAEALEISMRRNRKRALSSRNSDDILNKDGNKESSRTDKHSRKVGKEKDDLVAELRELGWSDMDLHSEDQKPVPSSLESELSSLLGDVSQRTGEGVGARGIDKTPVIALKRKALALKREGKLAEAKEELKKAKVLEKQLEEQEILGEAEDSDDELSGIIASMDDDEQDEISIQYKQEPDFSLDHLLGAANDLAESNFEVTDEDMEDPEITSALKSLGWAEDVNNIENIIPQSTPLDRESLSREILSLKREALNQKRTGNVGEAMAALKKAKLLEKDLERFEPHDSSSTTVEVNHGDIDFPDLDSKVGRRSKLMIQKELLAMKKKALALRREGKLHEAEEELKKSKILEQELEEMNNDSKAKATGNKDLDLAHELPVISRNLPTEEVEADVTDQDLHDPAYLSALKNLGWDEESEVASNTQKSSQRKDDRSAKMNNSVLTKAASDIPTRAPKRSKAEIQRELLNLKRKALSLRRQGLTDEAEEVLKMAKVLEAQLADLDAPREAQMEDAQISKENLIAKAGEDPGSVSTPVFANDQVVESTQVVKDDRPPLLGTADVSGFHGGVGGAQPSGFAPQPVQSANLTDLLTGDSWSSSLVPSVQLDSFPNLHEDGGNRNETKIENIEEKMKNAHENLHGNDTSPILGSVSSGDQTSLRQEVLACKKKAVVLKREGKLAEAREELRHAKLLEKSLEEDGIKPRTIQLEASVTTSRTTSDQQKELDASISSAPKLPLLAPKPPLSSRDRFKLQQESLSHKRQALKLRREGRMDEAEALFEKAKILEAQLDDSSANVGKNTDVVEDLLDPQLLSALKAIGLDDTNVAQQSHQPQRSEPVKSQRPERTEPVKLSPEKTQKIENSSPERVQLEEKIKAEKIKAVNFKRSGKQTEALEALRRAKLFEKKLGSLT